MSCSEICSQKVFLEGRPWSCLICNYALCVSCCEAACCIFAILLLWHCCEAAWECPFWTKGQLWHFQESWLWLQFKAHRINRDSCAHTNKLCLWLLSPQHHSVTMLRIVAIIRLLFATILRVSETLFLNLRFAQCKFWARLEPQHDYVGILSGARATTIII